MDVQLFDQGSMAVAALENLRWTSPLPLLGLITKIDQPSLQIVQCRRLKGRTCPSRLGGKNECWRWHASHWAKNADGCRLVAKPANQSVIEQCRRSTQVAPAVKKKQPRGASAEDSGNRERALLSTGEVRMCEVPCAPCVNTMPFCLHMPAAWNGFGPACLAAAAGKHRHAAAALQA